LIVQVSIVSFAILLTVYFLILRSEVKGPGFSAKGQSEGNEKSIDPSDIDDSMKTSVDEAIAKADENSLKGHHSSSNSPERVKHISINENKKAGPGVEDLAALFGFGAMTKPLQKTLSVVRIDISNLSDLKENLSPSSFFTMMDLFYSQLITAAETFQGEINHFDGHWALLAFGRILILDDHRTSAINAANAMNTLVGDIKDLYEAKAVDGEVSYSGLASDSEHSQYIPIKIKVAVATGTVIAGPIGKDIRQIFTLFGGPVDKVEELVMDAAAGAVVTD
jgi:class 3 adenylate cyclase